MGKSEAYEYPGLGIDDICPVCGKTYVRQDGWVYRRYYKGKRQYLCSWKCYREAMKARKKK